MGDIVVAHDCARAGEPYTPMTCKVVGISQQTPDVRSFRLQALDGSRPFDALPGQTAMFSVLPYGECMFAVTSQGEDYVELCVKRVGQVTERMHELRVGDEVGLRGPYGNWFPYDSARGRDMLFVAAGIGLPPVRSFLEYCLRHRADYGRIDLVYSASTKADLVYLDELTNVWPGQPDTHVHVSVYHGSDDWDGEVSYSAPFLEKVFAQEGLSPRNACATLCGGASFFRTCLESLTALGYDSGDIVTTLERRMKCGVGKCGRCNIGSHFICLEGPVFTQREVALMGAG
ncbi:MAG: FAD/NAD(P)-binding protein [Coriobacteriales bacterium]|jgi:NAD(P)H-flavin reductase